MQYRDRTFNAFDPAKPLVVQRQGTYMGHNLQPGDPLPAEVDVETCRRLWMSHYVTYQEDHTPTPELETRGEGKERMDEADGVTVTEGENGWYIISAAWLGDEGEKVHGAEDAEARAKELREAGDDKGVTFDHSGGGYYEVKAPWLDEPIKVKGKDAAEAKASELREQGAPEAPPTPVEELSEQDKLVSIAIEGEGDATSYIVTAAWLEEPRSFTGEGAAEAADARAAELREAGPPEGWTPADAENTGD